MTLSALLIYAAVYFAAVATPGPGIAALVARVIAWGLVGVAPFILGFVVGDLIWLTVAATGLALVARTYATLFSAIKIAGAVYLIYVAWGLARTHTATEASTPPRPAPGSGRAFFGALALTLGNPKVIVFFLSIMPLAVDLAQLTLSRFALLAVAQCGHSQRDAVRLRAGGQSSAGVDAFEPRDGHRAEDRGRRDGGRGVGHRHPLRGSSGTARVSRALAGSALCQEPWRSNIDGRKMPARQEPPVVAAVVDRGLCVIVVIRKHSITGPPRSATAATGRLLLHPFAISASLTSHNCFAAAMSRPAADVATTLRLAKYSPLTPATSGDDAR